MIPPEISHFKKLSGRGIPSSTPLVTIFLLDESSKTFEHRFYSPSMTDGRASIQEVRHVLKEIEAPMNALRDKRVGSVVFLLAFIVITFLLYIGLQAEFEGDQGGMKMVFIVVVVIFFVIFLIYHLMIGDDLNWKCKDIAKKHNQAFSALGLSWHIPFHFPKWVELRNDYLKEDAADQSIYVPPEIPMSDEVLAAAQSKNNRLSNESSDKEYAKNNSSTFSYVL